MKKLLGIAVLCLALQGCGALVSNGRMPVYIRTGNPVSDVFVSALVEEGARRVASFLLDGAFADLMSFANRNEWPDSH